MKEEISWGSRSVTSGNISNWTLFFFPSIPVFTEVSLTTVEFIFYLAGEVV